MRLIVVSALLAVATSARAETGARSFTAIARSEAKAGRCTNVAELAVRVDRIDHVYFVDVFANDPDIVACKLPSVMAVTRWRPPPPAPPRAPPPPPPPPSTIKLGWYANVIALANTTEEQDPRDRDFPALPGKPGHIIGLRTAIGISVLEPRQWRFGFGFVVEGYTIDFDHGGGLPYGIETFLEVTRDGKLWFGPRVAMLGAVPDAFDDDDPVFSHGRSMFFLGGRVRYGDLIGMLEYTKTPAGSGFSLGLGLDGRPGRYAYLAAVAAAMVGVGYLLHRISEEQH